MRSRLLWIAAAPALAMAPEAHAAVFLTVQQAQALMFPGAVLTPAFHTLTADEAGAIERASGVHVLTRDLKVWRAPDGGWFFADEVVGKHDFIPFAVALDASGAVKDVEILEYRESYGEQVRNPAWRAQFTGKRQGAALKLDGDIRNISGATLSSKHITDGVKRLLATRALVLAPHAG
jgi:hypothetical protein